MSISKDENDSRTMDKEGKSTSITNPYTSKGK